MRRRIAKRCGTYMLGSLGLLLMVLVGKLDAHATPRHDTPSARAGAWLARRTLDGIGAIGWLVDRMSLQGSSRRCGPNIAGYCVDQRNV